MNDLALYAILGLLAIGLLINTSMTLALAKPVREMIESRRPVGPEPGTPLPIEGVPLLEGSSLVDDSGGYHLLVLSAHCKACAALMGDLLSVLRERGGQVSSRIALLWVSSSAEVPTSDLREISAKIPVFVETNYPPLTEHIGLQYTPAILKIGSSQKIEHEETVSIDKIKELLTH